MNLFANFAALVRLAVHRLAVVAVAATVAACSGKPPSYVEEITAARQEKDRMLRESAQSPVPADQRATWPPLDYYPPGESYRVPASLDPPARGAAQVIVMPTSTGQQREMRRAGTLKFSVRGQPLQLSAFSDVESNVPNRLFVPFGDLTNGKETYPGGRYLDLDPTATGLYEIDFNRAYSPYCAYNPTYDCPFPPPENRLKVEIRAGEKYRQGGQAERLRPARGAGLPAKAPARLRRGDGGLPSPQGGAKGGGESRAMSEGPPSASDPPSLASFGGSAGASAKAERGWGPASPE